MAFVGLDDVWDLDEANDLLGSSCVPDLLVHSSDHEIFPASNGLNGMGFGMGFAPLEPEATAAHLRSDCPTHIFSDTSKRRDFCEWCLCYICDIEASACPAWEEHQAALPNSYWDNIKSQWRHMQSTGGYRQSNINGHGRSMNSQPHQHKQETQVPQKPRHKCKICGAPFLSEASVRSHVNSKHSSKNSGGSRTPAAAAADANNGSSTASNNSIRNSNGNSMQPPAAAQQQQQQQQQASNGTLPRHVEANGGSDSATLGKRPASDLHDCSSAETQPHNSTPGTQQHQTPTSYSGDPQGSGGGGGGGGASSKQQRRTRTRTSYYPDCIRVEYLSPDETRSELPHCHLLYFHGLLRQPVASVDVEELLAYWRGCSDAIRTRADISQAPILQNLPPAASPVAPLSPCTDT